MKTRDYSTHMLAGLLCFGILTLWITERWALGLYQAVALSACVVLGIRIILEPESVRWSKLLIPLALVPVWGLAQIMSGLTIYPWETWNAVLNWTTNFALFFLALQIAGNRRSRDRFLRWFLYFGVGLSVLSTVQMFTSGGKIFWIFPSGYSDFVLGPFLYKNQYAAFVESVLPIALYQGVTSKRPFAYWAIAAVMVASVVASASRAGTVLVFAEVLIVPLLASLRERLPARTTALALGSGLALSVIFIAVVGWGVMWNRFKEADPYLVRHEMLRSSVQMVHARPAMGFGLGTWSTAYPAFALYDDGTFANQAHNDWAQWAVEGGLPLLLAMLIFAGLLARLAWTSLWGFGLIFVLLHALVDYPMQQRPALAGWFFALAGVLAAQTSSRASRASHRAGGVR